MNEIETKNRRASSSTEITIIIIIYEIEEKIKRQCIRVARMYVRGWLMLLRRLVHSRLLKLRLANTAAIHNGHTHVARTARIHIPPYRKRQTAKNFDDELHSNFSMIFQTHGC